MKKEKKVFVMGKVYTITETNISEIERAVQEDLDAYVGKNKVIFKLYIAGEIVAMYFYRGIDYKSDPEDMIMDADAYMITGEGYEGFRMPAQFPKVPLQCTYSMEQSEFIKAYIESAELLGADKIKKAWLEIDGGKIVLRMKTK